MPACAAPTLTETNLHAATLLRADLRGVTGERTILVPREHPRRQPRRRSCCMGRSVAADLVDADLSGADFALVQALGRQAVQRQPDRHQIRGRDHAGQHCASVTARAEQARSANLAHAPHIAPIGGQDGAMRYAGACIDATRPK